MNAAAFRALRTAHSVNYIGPVNPAVIGWQKAASTALRLMNAPADFYFFSSRRLDRIARAVQARRQRSARLDFFHGFTPWILTEPERPYVAWSDCTFRDYIDVFHRRSRFRYRDLERIERAEAAWLANASRVLFTSQWAAARAIRDYGLDPARVSAVGIFGEIDVPIADVYDGARTFAFISTAFEAKGGRTVLAAFHEVQSRHPDATLVIVGDPPHFRTAPRGVRVTGFLRKEVPHEYARFVDILQRARALVHATTSDVAPLSIVEAGYCGCPVISSRQFAIPELVDDWRTGLLLDDATDVDAVASAMNWILEQEHEYRRMREAVRAKARDEHSRRRFEERLLLAVSNGIAA